MLDVRLSTLLKFSAHLFSLSVRRVLPNVVAPELISVHHEISPCPFCPQKTEFLLSGILHAPKLGLDCLTNVAVGLDTELVSS